MEKRFDFSSRVSCLPRDKSGKELRFDECPSGGRGVRFFRRHRYPRGPAIHETRTQYRAQQKLHAHLGFAWSAWGPAATTISRRRLSKPPLRRKRCTVNVALRVPLCERSTRCHGGYRGVTPWLKSLSCEIHLPVKPAWRNPSTRKLVVICILHPLRVRKHFGSLNSERSFCGFSRSGILWISISAIFEFSDSAIFDLFLFLITFAFKFLSENFGTFFKSQLKIMS